jgi:hypothetical protein
MPPELLLQQLIEHLKPVDGLRAIVLGGSYASGSQRSDSDIPRDAQRGAYSAEMSLQAHSTCPFWNEISLPLMMVDSFQGAVWSVVETTYLCMRLRIDPSVSVCVDQPGQSIS